MLKRPKLLGLGVVPPIVTSIVLGALFGIVVWQAPGLAGRATTNDVLATLLAGAIVVGTALLLVVTFTAVTLAVGAPVYDKISEVVDHADGAGWEAGLAPTTAQSISDAIKRLGQVIAITIPVSLVILLLGLIPGVGGVVAAVCSAAFGGWMISIELSGAAAERRGLRTLRDRNDLLRRSPWLVLGFGVPTFLLLSVPFLAIVLFPVATAGGTLLARRLLSVAPKG